MLGVRPYWYPDIFGIMKPPDIVHMHISYCRGKAAPSCMCTYVQYALQVWLHAATLALLCPVLAGRRMGGRASEEDPFSCE